jgi:transposase IS166 family protein
MATITVLSGPERRLRWASSEKAAIVEESLRPGAVERFGQSSERRTLLDQLELQLFELKEDQAQAEAATPVDEPSTQAVQAFGTGRASRHKGLRRRSPLIPGSRNQRRSPRPWPDAYSASLVESPEAFDHRNGWSLRRWSRRGGLTSFLTLPAVFTGCVRSDRSNFGKPLDCVFVVPADGGFPCG